MLERSSPGAARQAEAAETTHRALGLAHRAGCKHWCTETPDNPGFDPDVTGRKPEAVVNWSSSGHAPLSWWSPSVPRERDREGLASGDKVGRTACTSNLPVSKKKNNSGSSCISINPHHIPASISFITVPQKFCTDNDSVSEQMKSFTPAAQSNPYQTSWF